MKNIKLDAFKTSVAKNIVLINNFAAFSWTPMWNILFTVIWAQQLMANKQLK